MPKPKIDRAPALRVLNTPPRPDADGASPMMLAYAQWKHARAALEQADADTAANPRDFNDGKDKTITDALDRARACEWTIIQTCVQNALDVRLRAMALSQVYLDAEMAGEPTDHRHQMMLLALIHDVLDPRFSWGEHH